MQSQSSITALGSEQPDQIEHHLREKMLLILDESGFGQIVIKIERVKNDRVAVMIDCGSSQRLFYSEKILKDWLASVL